VKPIPGLAARGRLFACKGGIMSAGRKRML
jgi:hypothetical protein